MKWSKLLIQYSISGWLENNCCNTDLHNELKLTIHTFQPQLISPDAEYITKANKKVLISQSLHVCEWVSDVGGEGFWRVWHQWFNLAPLCCGLAIDLAVLCLCVCVVFRVWLLCLCSLIRLSTEAALYEFGFSFIFFIVKGQSAKRAERKESGR